MLKIEFTDQRFDSVWIVDKQFAIGSGEGNQLVINDPSVSPQHARLITTSDGYLLKDSGSHQGTFVNGVEISQARVKAEDVIRLGDVELRLLDPFESVHHLKGSPRRWSLVACSSFLSGQEFPLVPKDPKSQTLILGRGKQCDIVFPGTHLSRQHLAITLESGLLRLKDLGSANGTFVNEKKISEGTALPGDKIRLDIYTFRVLGPSSPQEQSIFDEPSQATVRVAAPKQWITRPTSPGNREETPTEHQSTYWLLLGIALLVGFVAIIVYLFGF